MAKEMMIIFVYDMEYCKSEADDPASAILYFYPNWVSDQQRTSLCGQIMGSTHFLKSVFSCPKILSLQSGKFSIREFGRYILAVGTDRNIDDWLLEHRTNILTSLIKFFHNDLESVSHQSQNYNNFTEKLYAMFETYLRILQYSGNIFANVPLLQLPKSGNNVFLEAIQILQYCQEMKSVLGGTMLYHNKVVATQLSSDLTKQLVITDPYRIKSPAEMVKTNFSLPLGVQLLHVYINYKEYRNLQSHAIRLQNLSFSNITKSKKFNIPKTKEPVLSAMKRDQSLIFTTVPEEDSDHTSPTILPEPVIRTVRPDRPKSLSLKSSNNDIKLNKTDSVVCTPFTGKTSVCSTPLVEKMLHGMSLSIINTEIDIIDRNHEKFTEPNQMPIDTYSESLNSVLSAASCLKSNAEMEEIKIIPVPESFMDKKHSSSLIDIKNITKNIELDETDEKKHFKTITDPYFPVFKPDGTIISKSLYDLCVIEHCELLTKEFTSEISKHTRDTSSITDDWKSIENFDSDISIIKPNGILSPLPPKKSQETRRALSLPLKSLNSEDSSMISSKRNLGGVQLTPLMSKLSLLAMEEEKSSGFCSRDTTPSEFRDFGLTPMSEKNLFSGRKNLTRNDVEIEDDDGASEEELQKVVLFVCGQQDMVLGLLIEEDVVDNSELVQKLWEICIETLGRLELQLRQCLDPYPVATSDQGETYSYLCVDPQWDTTQRGGPWGVPELGALAQLHREFTKTKNLTEITLRSEDGIIYGYRCGENEVFYQQSASSNAGLPPPADPMGVVPLKARRKLERDHALILL